MILGLEIGLTVFGIITLVKRKMSLGKGRHLIGWPAILLGILMTVTLLVVICAAFMVGLVWAILDPSIANNPNFDQDHQWTFVGIEAGLVIGWAAMIAIAGTLFARNPEFVYDENAPRRRKRAVIEDDDEEYEEYEAEPEDDANPYKAPRQ